jgi:predicted ATPase/DNA-binding SARP family transcriptional activator
MKSANEFDARRRPTPIFETETVPLSVRIQLLGGFRVVVDGRVVPETAWRLGNARRLIQILALTPGHSLHREQIMDLFWPDLTPKAAAGNLYQVVHAARRALNAGYAPESQPAAIIHLRQRVVTLEPPGNLEIDVDAFDQAAGAARQTTDPQRCREAITLYTGDLLPEQLYDDWLVARRLVLRDTVTTLLFQEARLHECNAAYDAAIAALQRVIEIQPENEQAQADLMRVLTLNGQSALALSQFKRWSEHLRHDLGEEPGDAIVRLNQDIAAGRIGPGISNRSSTNAPAPLTNLKEALTSFIGRQAELAHVLEFARQHRLLTLTGTGGCGKSRLARAAATMLIDEFQDGVWWVELAARTEPGAVATAIAAAVNVIEERGRPLEATLVDALRQRRLLIVLDNCEHMIESCAALCTTILESCPRIHILATSRRRLLVAGEQAWRVPSLTLPDVNTPPTIGQIYASEAVQLFVERARLTQSSFAIDAGNASIIATICRRLDGIPLAIELAAARVGVLGLGQIAERLDDTLRLLTEGSRSISPRHRTLRAALDWGYGLLSAPQQRALSQLSVFAGGWTLEAAADVLDGEHLTPVERQDLVLQLAEQSLVQVEQIGAGTRYQLLEIVRQYASERLAESGQCDAAHQRHASYYARRAAATEAILRGPDQATGLERLDAEIENCLAAVAWSCQISDAELGLQLCWGLWRYWQTRGNLTEGRQWMVRVLELPPPACCLDLHAGVLFAAARFALLQSDESALDLAQQCLSRSRAIGHQHHATGALTMLGHLAMQRGETATAREYYEEALTIRRDLGEIWSVAISLNSLGLVALEEQDIERARNLFDESLKLFRAAGDTYHVANGLYYVGLVSFLAGDHAAARRAYDECEAIHRQMGERVHIARGLVGLAQLSSAENDLPGARALLAEALAISVEVGSRETLVTCLEEFAILAASGGDPVRAIQLAAAAQALHDDVGEPAQRHMLDRLNAGLEPARQLLTGPELTAAEATGKLMCVEEATHFAITIA